MTNQQMDVLEKWNVLLSQNIALTSQTKSVKMIKDPFEFDIVQ